MNRRTLALLVAAIGLVIATIIYIQVSAQFTEIDQRNVRLEELLALTALTFLYLAILPHSLRYLFSGSRFVSLYQDAQPALAAAAMFFGATHGYIAFFFLLGGFGGLSFLSAKFLTGIILSSTALLSLILVFAGNYLSNKYKWFGGLIYVAGILIVIHAMMLGTDFAILSATIPRVLFGAIAILIMLEAAHLDRILYRKGDTKPVFGPVFATMLIVLGVGATYFFLNADKVNVGIHSGHQGVNTNLLNLPGMTGDATKRYSVDWNIPANVQPNQDVEIKLRVYDAANGNLVTDYKIINDKLLHLIITDSSLQFFNHIHPTLKNGEFSVITRFPKSDLYRLYTDFQPNGAWEQQIGSTLQVGGAQPSKPLGQVEPLTKTFNGMEVTLSSDSGRFEANSLANMQTTLTFSFKDSATKEPITDLMPYLGSFGHMVMISEATYNYTHVHPQSTLGTGFAGPDIKFLPMSMYEKMKPGIYRVFGQFNRADQIFTVDFTINVQ